ncbi:MAG: YesL family protein [Clostridiales bacterium]|nr:YesL family protein [Clostridiales bacterium]
MRLFSYDSKFSQIMLKLCYGCYLNLLWLVCSLPVFTAGAATAALYDVTLRLAREEDPPVTTRFFKAFRENFRQATILWMILLGIGALLGADGYILYHLYKSTAGMVSVICTLGLALIIVAAIAYVIVLIYVFPLVASVKNTNFAMLKNALLIGIHYLFCTILVFAIHFAMFFAVVAVFTPLIVLGEGLCALLSSYLLGKVIRACSYDPAEEEAGQA